MAEKPTYEELEKRVNELEQAEYERGKIEDAKSRFQMLYEKAPLGYQSLDEYGNIIEVNIAWLDILGYSREEVIGESFSEFLHPEWKKHFKDNFPRFKAVGEILGVEFEMLKKDGTFILVSFNGKIGKDNSGGFKQTHYIFQDITERKRAEDALLSEKLITDKYIDCLPGLFYVFDEQNFIRWNSEWNRITGYSDEELANMYGTDFFEGYDRVLIEERMLKVFRDGWAEAEAELVTKEGRRLPYYFTGRRKMLNGKEHLIGLGIDITVRKRIEEEKQSLHKKLLKSQKMEAIGTLAGGMAHDFNNMLGVIIGNAELAMDDLPEWTPARHNLEEIKTAGLRSRDVVREILSFSSKSHPTPKKPVEISDIINDAIKFLRASIPTSIEIRKIIPDESGIISADPTQIHQVIMNLCTNAAHAMSENGGIMDVGLSVINISKDEAIKDIELNQGQYVKLIVRDTGHGMPAEHLDKIFDPYFTTKEAGEGSGIGLSVVHGIVKSHNGAIFVDSECGQGTTFNVFFPVVEEDPVLEETDTTIPTGNERILFVDDEKSIADMAGQMLERLGYTVTAKTSSTETLETFRTNPDNFDLIISDMCMPKMAGDKLAKEIVQIRPDIPIILCTGYSEKIDDEKAKSIGFKALVMKPIVKSILAQTIRKILDSKSVEHRRSKRFKAKDGTVAMPKSDLQRQYKILDISEDGLSFNCAESKDLSQEFAEFAICLADEGFILYNLPGRNILDLNQTGDSSSGVQAIKRYCIQFGKMTSVQKDKLDHFLQNHTISYSFDDHT